MASNFVSHFSRMDSERKNDIPTTSAPPENALLSCLPVTECPLPIALYFERPAAGQPETSATFTPQVQKERKEISKTLWDMPALAYHVNDKVIIKIIDANRDPTLPTPTNDESNKYGGIAAAIREEERRIRERIPAPMLIEDMSREAIQHAHQESRRIACIRAAAYLQDANHQGAESEPVKISESVLKLRSLLHRFSQPKESASPTGSYNIVARNRRKREQQRLKDSSSK